MKRIQFDVYGSNTVIGNFGPGDIFRCGDALARHFVDELKLAHYLPPLETKSDGGNDNRAGKGKAPRGARA